MLGRFGRQQRFDFGPKLVRHERLSHGTDQSSLPLYIPVLLGALSDRKDYRLEKIAIIVLTFSAIDRVQKSPPIWNQVARLAIFLALFDLDGQESWERQLLY